MVNLKQMGDEIASTYEQLVNQVIVEHGELTLLIPANAVGELVEKLKVDNRHGPFQQLIDICCVDYPDRDRRFEVVYHLLSLSLPMRIRLKLSVDEGQNVPSINDVFPAANWFEREAFDMYGVVFSDHPDLRRLLTDYGFDGHPLRKDFPLTGHVEVRYDNSQKRVVQEPVTLTQDYRDFDFESPWDQIQEAVKDA